MHKTTEVASLESDALGISLFCFCHNTLCTHLGVSSVYSLCALFIYFILQHASSLNACLTLDKPFIAETTAHARQQSSTLTRVFVLADVPRAVQENALAQCVCFSMAGKSVIASNRTHSVMSAARRMERKTVWIHFQSNRSVLRRTAFKSKAGVTRLQELRFCASAAAQNLAARSHTHFHRGTSCPPQQVWKTLHGVHLAVLSLIVLFCLSFFSFANYCLSLTRTVLSPSLLLSLPPSPLSLSSSLSLSLSLSTLYHVLFTTTHGLSRYLLPQSHRRISSPTRKKNKKTCSTNRKRLPAPRMFSFPKKKKKRKEQPKLHHLAFLLILRALQPALFFCSCSARSCPFVPLPSASKLLSFFTNKIKKNAALLKKVLIRRESSLFQKKKKKKRKRNLMTSTSHSFSHCKRYSLRFFSATAAREAALLAASRCSFKIWLQYPWKLQRFAYKKLNLAAVWPGP